MEISNLLDKIKGGEKEAPKNFLALEVSDEIVQAAVWQVVAGHTEVLAIGIPVEWDGEKGDSTALVSATDATIASAVEGISEEPDSVIFGLSSSWIEAGDISLLKRPLLKAISHDLELKALGFVVVTDSLLHYLKTQEGTPTTAILVQIAADSLNVMLLRFGKIESSVNITRSDDVAIDLEEGLSRFPITGNLPSRIIVFNSMHNLDEIVQNLLSYDWQNKFKFLHVPKIESLPKDILIKSIAIAGGSEVAKSMGFTIEENSLPTDEEPIDQEELVSAEELGFSPSKKLPPSPIPLKEISPPSENQPPILPPPPKVLKPKRSIKLPKLSLPKLSLPKLSPLLTILSLSFVSLLVIVFAAIWLIPKAEVTIKIEPKVLEEKTSFTLSSLATSLDTEKAIVPATLVTRTVKGEDTLSTTGNETIGDKSSGEVTIYNRTTLPKTFPAGTTLTANSLKFTLDEEVTVASSSSTVDSELKTISTPGKSTVKLTANTIGKDSNLPENTEFTIGNFSVDTYLAKNNSALSGGSSTDIKVVGKEDQVNLLNSLTSKLELTARQEISEDIGNGRDIYLFVKGTKIINQEFSSKVGDETDFLTLNLEIEIRGLNYEIKNVEELVASTLTRAIPSDYERTSAPPTVEFGDVLSEGSEEVETEAKIIVSLLPIFDKAMIQTALKGSSPADVQNTLSNLVGLQSAEADITPLWLPTRYKRMPRNPNNISVTIEAAN